MVGAVQEFVEELGAVGLALGGASSCWAWRVGRNSMLVWKNAQVSQIDSKAQSSSGGLVQ